MNLRGLARRYTAFVLVPSLVAGLVAAVFMSAVGASPGYAARAALHMAWGAAVFCIVVAWPVAAVARWRGLDAGPRGMVAAGALLGALFAVLVSNAWLARSGAPVLSWGSAGTVWFTVLAFGVPVGVFSAAAAWMSESRR